MKRFIPGVLSLLLISGCATSYQPKGVGGGFSETQLRQDIYRVRFQGNGYTSEERAVDFTLLRCAELALESGYQFFLIFSESQTAAKAAFMNAATTGSSATINSGSDYIAGNSTSTIYNGQVFVFEFPRTLNTILLLHDPNSVDGMAYGARYIIKTIRNKYRLGPSKNHGSYRVDTRSTDNSRHPNSMEYADIATIREMNERLYGARSNRSRRIEYADNREYDDGVSEMGKIFRVETAEPE